MNTYALVAFLCGFAVIVSFFSGIRAEARMGRHGHMCSAEMPAWELVFYIAVFVTILVAPLA